MKRSILIIGLLLGIMILFAAAVSADGKGNWPQWRGPDMTGVSPDGNPPIEWSENKNVKWKIAIPGKGHATPIVWGDRIFILTAVPKEKEPEPVEQASGQQGRRGMSATRTSVIHRFVVLAIDRIDGKIVWERTVKEELPQEATHEFGSWASHSPVTDGEHVYAYFGSRGLYCLDMQGNVKWERDFGQMTKVMEFGEGSSPALYGNKIIVNWDHEGDSFIAALDKKTGKDVWKVDRDEGTSWATPLVVEYDGRTQIITSATKLIRSYDLATGDLIWECGGMTRNAIPSPMEADGIVYVTSGFRGNALLAIDLSKAKGDITGTEAVVWNHDKDTPYAPSGVLYEGMLYLLRSNNGSLSCFDAATGKEHYNRQRLEGSGNVFASPVAAKGRIYVLGQQGSMYVIKHGPAFEILAKNQLEGTFNASPAIVGDSMYLRSYEHLYCIEQQ